MINQTLIKSNFCHFCFNKSSTQKTNINKRILLIAAIALANTGTAILTAVSLGASIGLAITVGVTAFAIGLIAGLFFNRSGHKNEISTNIQQKKEIAEIEKVEKVNQSETKTNSFKTVNIVTNFMKNSNTLYDLMNLVDQINNTTPDFKIKIRLTTDPIAQTERLEFGHTGCEIETLCELYPQLLKYFRSRKGNILSKGVEYPSEKGLLNGNYLNQMELLKTLKNCYNSLPHLAVPLPELPQFCSFSGDDKQIDKIFTSLLSCSEGLVIGEYTHRDKMPKTVLIQQMEHLYSLGIRTLFLEHCCFDTLQPELDEFFQTKQPSAFLAKFLKEGFGNWIGKENYFDLVQAAVKVGIRPVGLEKSNTQRLGFEQREGSQGEIRMLGLNVTGKQIIAEQKGKEKYIVLVGVVHNSYSNDIAGFSELCGIPSLVIKDSRKNKAKFQSHTENLGFTDTEEIKAMFGNKEQVFKTAAHLELPKERIE